MNPYIYTERICDSRPFIASKIFLKNSYKKMVALIVTLILAPKWEAKVPGVKSSGRQNYREAKNPGGKSSGRQKFREVKVSGGKSTGRQKFREAKVPGGKSPWRQKSQEAKVPGGKSPRRQNVRRQMYQEAKIPREAKVQEAKVPRPFKYMDRSFRHDMKMISEKRTKKNKKENALAFIHVTCDQEYLIAFFDIVLLPRRMQPIIPRYKIPPGTISPRT